MALVDKTDLKRQKLHAHAFGDAATRHVIVTGQAVAIDDDLKLLPIPRGMRIDQVDLVVETVAAANAAMDVGYVDTAKTGAVHDVDHFHDGVAIAAAAKFRSAAPPYAPTKDGIFLSVRPKTVALATGTKLHLLVHYVYEGA